MTYRELLDKRGKLHNFLDEENIDIGFCVFSGEIIVYGTDEESRKLEVEISFRDEDDR